MKKQATALSILFAALLWASLAPVAQAEYLVPEGNSAVNQYTEGVPSAGGQKGTRNGEFSEPVSTQKKIGAKNAEKLSEQGAEGQAAAEVAAETAPEPVAAESNSEPAPKKSGKSKKGHESQAGGNENGKQKSGGGGGATSGEPPASGGDTSASGSSSTSGILAAATGAEDGHLGLLLPLIIVAALAWGVAYAVRDRKRSAER